MAGFARRFCDLRTQVAHGDLMGLVFIVSNPHFRPHLEFGSLFCTPRCVRHVEGAGIAEIPYKTRSLEKGSARQGPRRGAPQSRRSRGRVTRQSDNPSPGLAPAAPGSLSGSLSGSAARGAALGPGSPAGRSCRDRVGLSLGLPCEGNGEVRAAAGQRSAQIPKLLPSPCRKQ